MKFGLKLFIINPKTRLPFSPRMRRWYTVKVLTTRITKWPNPTHWQDLKKQNFEQNIFTLNVYIIYILVCRQVKLYSAWPTIRRKYIIKWYKMYIKPKKNYLEAQVCITLLHKQRKTLFSIRSCSFDGTVDVGYIAHSCHTSWSIKILPVYGKIFYWQDIFTIFDTGYWSNPQSPKIWFRSYYYSL